LPDSRDPGTSGIVLCPQPLRTGDRIAVVAPSGPFDAELFEAGVARLATHFEVIVPAGLRGRTQGFLAGSDDERRAELQSALDDRSHRALWIARGGYGSARLLDSLDAARFANDPPWLIGFSDATALHQIARKRGALSLHGPNLTGLGALDAGDFEALLWRLQDPFSPDVFDGLLPLGDVPSAPISGELVGGNLTVLFAEAAAGRLNWSNEAVLVLEDVTEASYRVDRMLTALAQNPALPPPRAILFGDFTDCSAGKFGVPVLDVLRERAAGWDVPAFTGLPVGHGARNRGFLHGARAELDPLAGRLTVKALS